jgi:MFS family permease
LPAGSYGSGNDWMAPLWHVQNDPFPNLYWATASWNVGAALFPLLFVPLTENTGRMPGYFIGYIVFELFLFGSAFADNFATIVVTRFFGGGASSVAINIVGGSISDIWKGDKARSLPMSLFGFTSVAGIALGPFVGSAIVQIRKPDVGLDARWRWIYYIQIIYNAALIPVFWFILRETRGDVILKKRAQKLRKETGREIYAESELDKPSVASLLKLSFKRPTKMLLTEPVVIFFTLWISFAWGILFLFFSSVVQTFGESYNFDIFQTGLVQLAITVGALIGTLINPLQDWLYLRTAKKNKERPGKPIPEGRLYTSIPGSLLFTAGLFIYGWTCRPSIHWIVPGTCTLVQYTAHFSDFTPAIGVTIVGVGIYSIYMGVVNYLTDAYEKYAASALSAASLGRNTFGAFLPLASGQLFSTLGFGWAGSLLGFVGLALSVVPVVLLFKGREIRAKSPFMLDSTFDGEEQDERKNSYSRKGQGRSAEESTGGDNEV